MSRALALWAALLLLPATAQAAAQRGSAAPAIEVPKLGGGVLRLADLRGKVVLVDFWASWCEPCQRELPALATLQREFGSRGLQVITINIDQQEKNAATQAQRLGVTLPVGLDPKGDLAAAYDLPKMPTSYVLDREGVVRFIHEGFDGAKDIARLRAELNSLLGAAR